MKETIPFGHQENMRVEVRPISRRNILKTGVAALAAAGLGRSTLRAGATNPLGFCPISGLPGEVVNLFGPNFGVTVPDLCLLIHNGTQMAFTKPIVIENGEVQAQIRSVPAGMQPGVFEVVLGEGYQDMPANMPTGLTLTEPICSWMGNGGSRSQSFQNFTFPWAGAQGTCLSYWGGLDGNGRLSADMTIPYDENCCPTCPPGTRMTLRAYGATAGSAFEFHYQASLINTVTLYASQIADALCAIFVSAFNSNFSISMLCNQTPINDSQVNITIGTPDSSPFISGGINIEINHNGGVGGCYSISDSVVNSLTRSLAGSIPGSLGGDCLSIGPGCPSINVDFVPFIFA